MVWGIIILAFLAAPIGMSRIVNIHLFVLMICLVVGFFSPVSAGALFGYWIMSCIVYYFLVFFYLWVRYC